MRWGIGCMLLAVAGCASQASFGPAVVDDTYRHADGQMTTSTGVFPIKTYVKAFEKDGKLALCGAYSVDGNRALSNLRGIAWRQAVVVNGINAGRTSFFSLNDPAENPQPANCIVTDIDWQSRFGTRPAIQVVDEKARW